MKDIEMLPNYRKQKSTNTLVNNKDVDEVVAVMGQPEDYRIMTILTNPTFETFQI
jgi:hypothetical protein